MHEEDKHAQESKYVDVIVHVIRTTQTTKERQTQFKCNHKAVQHLANNAKTVKKKTKKKTLTTLQGCVLQRSCITIRDTRDEDKELFIGRVNSNETDLNGTGKDEC